MHEERGFNEPSYFRPDLYGFAFLLTWIFLFLYSAVPGTFNLTPGALTSQIYLWSVLGLTLTLALCAWRAPGFVARSNTPAIRLSAPLATAAGSALCCLGNLPGAGGIALVAFGALLTGYGSAVIVLRWTLVFEQSGPRVVLANLPLFLAITVTLCFTSTYLAPLLVIAVIIVLPILSGLCLEFAQSHMDRDILLELDNLAEPVRRIEPKTRRALEAFVVCILIIGVAAGFLDELSGAEGSFGFGAFYDLANFALLFALVVFVESRLHLSGTDVISSLVFPAMLIAAVTIPFSVHNGSDGFYGLAQAGSIAYEVLFFSTSVLIAHEYRTSAVRVYAIVRIVNALANFLGSLIASSAFVDASGNAVAPVATIAIIIAVEATLVYLVIACLHNDSLFAASREDATWAADAQEGGDGRGNGARPDGTKDGEARFEGTQEDGARSGGVQDGGTRPGGAQGDGTRVDGAQDGTEGGNVGNGDTLPRPSGTSGNVKPRFRDSLRRIEMAYALSKRETDVFELLAKRMTSKQIQEELNISANTVAFHSKNIYVKLDVHSKQELVELAESYRV